GIERGDVVLFDHYGKEAVGIVVAERFHLASPNASYVRLYSPDTMFIHQYGYFGNYRVLFQPNFPSTRRALLDYAEQHYKSKLLAYPAWRKRFELEPDYPLWS